MSTQQLVVRRSAIVGANESSLNGDDKNNTTASLTGVSTVLKTQIHLQIGESASCDKLWLCPGLSGGPKKVGHQNVHRNASLRTVR